MHDPSGWVDPLGLSGCGGIGPLIERDAHGNEIFYRTMSEKHFLRLLNTDKIPATGETFISPLEAYAKNYNGVLIRLKTKPGTMAQLLDHGFAANAGTASHLPTLPISAPPNWGQTAAQFKLEGTGRININNGNGVINTGLGKGNALTIFNENIIEWTRIR